MATGDELLAKLEQWLERQDKDPTIFDVIATRDQELTAAFILKGLQAAARRAAIDTVQRRSQEWSRGAALAGTARFFNAFDQLSKRWSLSEPERLRLLGVDAQELSVLRAKPLDEVPVEIIERIATLVGIARVLMDLLPRESSTDGWIKRPNRAPLFGGRTALDFMMEGPEGMRVVRSYLLAQLYGN